MKSTPLAADQRPWRRVRLRCFAASAGQVCARAVWRAKWVIIGATVATAILHHYHLLDPFESAALDANIAWTPVTQTNTVIVTINDDDYQNMFDGRSPLDAGTLKSLIAFILSGQPATLGVDIVTAEPADATLKDLEGASRVVWVRDALQITDAQSEDEGEPRWRLGGVLGGDAPPAGAATGLSLFPRDPDGFVRRYYRVPSLAGVKQDERIVEPSFAWTILQRYCATHRTQQRQCDRVVADAQAPAEKPLWFNFAGDRYTFRKIPAGALTRAQAAPDSPPPDEFKDKIVLLGGTFGAARDTYPTLLGERSGVELTAFAIETELNGGGIKESNEWLMFAMDILAGMVLVCLSCFWPPESVRNIAATTAAMFLLALAVSFAAFHAFSYWGSFVPIGVSVLLHQFHERMHVARHTRQELEQYRQRYGPL